MDILLYLIPITLLLALIWLFAFFWNVKNNQYDDLKGSSNRILLDKDDINEIDHNQE